jgi:hypothetical protein
VPTLEPTVSEEKLRQLLDEGHESDLLDLKDMCNLDEILLRLLAIYKAEANLPGVRCRPRRGAPAAEPLRVI